MRGPSVTRSPRRTSPCDRTSRARTCPRLGRRNDEASRCRRTSEVAVVVDATRHVIDEVERAIVAELLPVPGAAVAVAGRVAVALFAAARSLVASSQPDRNRSPADENAAAVVFQLRVDRLEARRQRIVDHDVFASGRRHDQEIHERRDLPREIASTPLSGALAESPERSSGRMARNVFDTKNPRSIARLRRARSARSGGAPRKKRCRSPASRRSRARSPSKEARSSRAPRSPVACFGPVPRSREASFRRARRSPKSSAASSRARAGRRRARAAQRRFPGCFGRPRRAGPPRGRERAA